MEKKFCIVCGKELKGKQKKFCSLNCKQKDFYENHNGKTNVAFRQFIRAARRKMEFVEMKGGKCEKCGYNENLTALEFHHIDPATKKFNLDGRILANGKYENLLEELDKCMLLCSNCHKEIHNENYNIESVKQILEENKDILGKETEVKYCKECGKILLNDNTSGYCKKCLAKRRRKVERPTKEELQEMIKDKSLTQIGKMYGVTRSSIKKWLIGYDIWKKN